MDWLLQDARYALIMMRRNRAFSAAGLLTLALGIGATTAVFSVVYGVLLRPLPYPASDRLVQLSEEHPGANSPLQQPYLSNLTFYAWRDPRTIEDLAAYRSTAFTIALPNGAERLTGASVTPSMFALLGQSPALGRFFLPSEGPEGANAFIVLSDRGWHERFGADPAVVGRSVVVDGKPSTIIGVARPGFYFPSRDTLMWSPLEVLKPSTDAVAGQRGAMNVITAFARLRPGVTPQQAEAEGTAAARATVRPMAANLLFGVGGPPVVHVRSVVSEMTARIRPALLVLAAGVVCVLLIACANVANLFLSRGVARQRELTVRAAIGASRGRLVRQLFTESFVLSALGGVFGLGLAWALVRMAPAFAASTFPRLDAIAIDARVVAFTAAAVLVTTILSGLAPALRGARFNLAESLHGGDGATAGGFRGLRARRLRDGLLVAEAAFAVLLLVGASLLARSFVRLMNVDAGYSSDRVLTAEVYIPGGTDPARAAATRTLVDDLLARTRALPGVAVAGATNMMPLDGSMAIAGFPPPWTAPGAESRPVRSLAYIVTPGYADALNLRLRRGRFFTDADVAGGVTPWIVNEEFARLYLPPQPIGYQWTYPATETRPQQINQVVGIVANTLKNGNHTTVQPEHYSILRSGAPFSGRFELAVRTEGDPAAVAPMVRDLVRTLAPSAAVETITLAKRLEDSVDEPRFATLVLVAFAAIALGLASIGLYGVLSYGVSQRRREIGVRAALGASRSTIVRQVIGEGLAVTGIGVLIGLAGAAVLTRLMQSALFGIEPLDPVSFAVAPLLLLPVAVLACLLPARRAAATDPADALRSN
jgi:putative ABC transport system permease protein